MKADTILVKERSLFQVLFEKRKKSIFSVMIYSFSNGIRVIVYGMTDLSCILPKYLTDVSCVHAVFGPLSIAFN